MGSRTIPLADGLAARVLRVLVALSAALALALPLLPDRRPTPLHETALSDHGLRLAALPAAVVLRATEPGTDTRFLPPALPPDRPAAARAVRHSAPRGAAGHRFIRRHAVRPASRGPPHHG